MLKNEKFTKGTNNKTQVKIIALMIFALGLLAIAASIVYNNEILAFIGLGFIFWGPLLIYISSDDYVKKELISSTASSSINNLNNILINLDYKGEIIYLPPKFFKNPEDTRIYISKTKKTKIPNLQMIQENNNKTFLNNPKALLLEPSGLCLVKLFESVINKRFTQLGLKDLEIELPKIFIDKLEIAKEIQLVTVEEKFTNSTSTKINSLEINIGNTIYIEFCETTNDIHYDNPLVSAIACLLTKVTQKPIVIEKASYNNETQTIYAKFRLLEKLESVQSIDEILLPQIAKILSSPYLTNSSLIFQIIGSLLLLWSGFIIWQDFAIWGKNLIEILFAARTGEFMSLGLDLKLINYILLGSAFLISGRILRKYKLYSTQIKEVKI